MKVSRENLEDNQVKLDVEVEKEEVNRAIDQVCRNIAKEVTIPGFRRGRAPKHILTRYVGQAHLEQEALEKLLQESYEKALQEAEVEPVDQPSIDIEEFKEGHDFRFTAVITVKPEPEVEDYDSISVAQEVAEVTDEDIQSVIDSLLDDQSVLESAGDDAEFGEGKHAVVMLKPSEDEEEPETGKEQEEHVIEFGRNQIFPGADEQLAGAKEGEERVITHRWQEEETEEETEAAPEGETDEETPAPSEVDFTILVKGICVKKTPELDDEFVASLDIPDVDTVEQLRDMIRERCKANNLQTARNAQMEEIHEELLENTEVDIPEVMIENRIDRLMDEFNETMQRRNMDMDTYLAAVQMEKEEFRSSFRERAENMVKLDLILEEVAREEGIECTEEDLQQVMGSLAQGYQQSPDSLKTMFQTEGFMEHLKSMVIKDKANKYLIDKATENAAENEDNASQEQEEVQEDSEEEAT